MQMQKIAHVNKRGLAEIADNLRAYHKFGDRLTQSNISAWAESAEDSFNNGNGCEFEIRSFDALRGEDIVVRISREGYDIEEVEVDA